MKPEPTRNAKHFSGSAKAEPLKDKIIDEDKDLSLSQNYFKEEDIKSAVEWLKEWHGAPITFIECNPQYKEELNITLEEDWREQLENDVKGSHTIIHDFNEWLIDKAFEDVIKK